MQKIITACLAMFVFSCSLGNKHKSADFKDTGKTISVEKIHSVVLAGQGSPIGLIEKLEIVDDAYFLLDSRKMRKVYQFTKDGRFVRSFVEHGQGPNEIVSLFDFDVHDGRLYILGRAGGRVKIILYDLEQNSVSEYFPTGAEPVLFNQVRVDDRHVYLATDFVYSDNRYVRVFDHHFQPVEIKAQPVPELNRYVGLTRRMTTGFFNGQYYYAGIFDHSLYFLDGAGTRYDFSHHATPYTEEVKEEILGLAREGDARFDEMMQVIQEYGYLSLVMNDGPGFFVLTASSREPFLYDLQDSTVAKVDPSEFIRLQKNGIMSVGPIAFEDGVLYFYQTAENGRAEISLYKIKTEEM